MLPKVLAKNIITSSDISMVIINFFYICKMGMKAKFFLMNTKLFGSFYMMFYLVYYSSLEQVVFVKTRRGL